MNNSNPIIPKINKVKCTRCLPIALALPESRDRPELRVYLGQQCSDLGGGPRRAEIIALDLGTALRPQAVELLARLHALGSGNHMEARAHCGDGANDGQALVLICHVANERRVDLDLVERELAQVAQGRITGA